VGLTRLVNALARFEAARTSAFGRSLRHPDGALLFVAVLAGLIVGSAIGRDIQTALAERVAAGIGIGVWVAFCIYGAGAGFDAVSELAPACRPHRTRGARARGRRRAER
jgi:hypothetical protein